jgi:hypothetical protein
MKSFFFTHLPVFLVALFLSVPPSHAEVNKAEKLERMSISMKGRSNLPATATTGDRA